MTYTIPVLLGTTRNDNESSKVANLIIRMLSEVDNVDPIFLDLAVPNFPMLTERVSDDNPISSYLTEWTSILQNAHAIIIVAPEYKSGYPGSLKNFLDFLPAGIFRYKPVGISTVSSGVYAGTSCLAQLRQVVIGMSGLVIPDRFQVGKVQEAFDTNNHLISERQQKVAKKFISELIKYTAALSKLQ